MTERKRDWEVVTGWEKRIKVDYGSIGPNHVRWSDWTYKERDIVARVVHEKTFIQDQHGPLSNAAEDFRREHAPIMVDFARDGKPMPDWAHADYRPSGIPEYVKVVWKRERPDDMASPADWAYDPPGPWEDKGEEPAWSARPMEENHDPNIAAHDARIKAIEDDYTPPEIIGLETEGSMDPKFGGVVSYKTMANGDHVATDGTVISTTESRAKEDVPQWRKFELGRLEILDNVVIPGPAAEPRDISQYGPNVKLTNRKIEPPPVVKIMPTDPDHTPLEKALNWAAETHHGPAHQDRWNRVAAAMGADNGYSPMTMTEVTEQWKRFGRNPRWTMAMEALETDGDDLVAVNRYREAAGLPPMQKSQQEKLREALVDINSRDDVVVKEFNAETQTLEAIESKPSEPVPQYRLSPMSRYGPEAPKEGATGWYTRKEKWLPDWYWDLPELTFEEGEAKGMTSRASVAPLHYIFHRKGVGILGRQKPAPEREDLPIWTKDQAAAYYRRKGIKMRSRQWLDGHLMQQPGYTDNGQGHGTFVARAADETFEAKHRTIAVPIKIADAIEEGSWEAVARYAKERADQTSS